VRGDPFQIEGGTIVKETTVLELPARVQDAEVDFLLHFFPGTGRTMTLEATRSGGVKNLTIDDPATVPVTATPVASCP
jgi:hypothetical protein